jgi:response regulator RpfG family c-di-GMP phosphodiesterase
LTHEEACRIIIEGKGTWFDPDVVDVFECVTDKFAELNVESPVGMDNLGKGFFYGANIGS